MPKVGGKRKKARTHIDKTENQERMDDAVPKSFILKRGKVSNLVKHIVGDMREIMYPYTAMNLKENDRTKIKEYVSSSKIYGISHMQIFTSTEKHNYLRFIKTPEGPTITFKIISYCTRKDVLQSQARKKTFSRNFKPPVLVMSGFNKELNTKKNIRNPPSKEQYQVVGQMIQTMFPPLNLKSAKISNIQRVVLFQYDNETDVISMRHFHISLVPVSSNKNMQKILRGNKTPNLRDYKDFSQFINKNKKPNQQSGNVSESDAEDVPDAKIELDKKSFKKQFTTRLHEIGPRLKLRLYKIEEGLLRGNVVYNRMVQKTSQEIEAQRKKIMEMRAEKEKRRQEQEKNVKKKKQDEKIKEKEKQKLHQQKAQILENQKNGVEEDNEEENLYDEPDEEEINDEEGYFKKDQDQDNDDDDEQAQYHGIDEDMQDFDDDFSEEESEQFIQDLEKQLKKLQQENKQLDEMSDEDEEDDDGEENSNDDEDDDEEDDEENDDDVD